MLLNRIVPALALLALAASAQAAATQTLPSGVTVEILTQGKGVKPKPTDTVKVNYRGTFKDGREFDSSYKNGGPISFPLNRVIPCWTQGVSALSVGSKAKLFCPAATAYGSRGAPGAIPPNTDLYFEVELLDIQK
ncbi:MULTISPECIES: FKBP-type peptidyl-prolyl cis-trans isomerase [Chromobacterium]|jgi:FKBP-type peptidyl-prolyl cis-trans isomerase FkpA|uniref:Peptidyl-prolyl cis-trans isomerase n=2 Tax=Chromobacterium TaxID=535 RepID=A0A1S1WXK8_9NEIS|nr:MULTISPECIES: FKBP-type peptidyl-prolyl cis-trans isomerase [Chromobacterium]KIA80683.1 FKBP-type peptidylprolyl isomerase [Chromobacterium piscinae]MDE1711922.1 FKBP-type peptidyl-prolyl cis-trans isomerase [Chromobacterium amazonense]MDQ4541417.1 FKBP-type peptidyl-prolyl cis-trans isomerase [Chromobacterium amazonense]OHX12012.1 FKBP-type peptidylprolyl isomerase [Chromobacterium amazonense]POA98320.1 FKBP-type peptidyl-prolyl cis-trans isomerase [Chromobacterium sinusclupearum]